MAEQRVYQGHIYTRNAPGEPWQMQGPAQASAPSMAIAPNAAVVARQAREEARKDDDQNMQRAAAARDETRIGMAAEADKRTAANQTFGDASKLRDDFNKTAQSKEYQTVIRQYAGALKTQPTPTGDQALITSYAKMLDPTSVVREQEFNTVASADSAIGKIVAKLNKEMGADESGLIRPEIRARVRKEMLNLTKGYNEAYNQQRQFYSKLAERSGIAPEDVVGPHLGAPFLPQIEQELTKQYQAAVPNPGANAAPGDTTIKDNGEYDAQGNFLGLAGSVSDDTPTPPSAGSGGTGGGYSDSILGQAMYGANEGLAGTLGLPVDIATAGINLIPQGINAIANTDIPTIQDPFLGGEWWKGALTDLGSIGPQTESRSGQFARRTGQSVGAAAVPIAGAAGGGGKVAQALLGALGGGVGAATAQQVAPGNPYAEVGGEIAGSLLAGGAGLGMARQRAQREIEAAVPTVPQLKEKAGNLYREAEATGVPADPMQTQQLAQSFRKTLRDEGQLGPSGRITNADTSTSKALNLVEQYQGLPMRPAEMNAVRRVVAEGRSSPEAADQRMAQILTGQFDDWARPMAPGFDDARDISSRYLQAQKLEDARKVADTRSSANSLRNEYANLERRDIRGSENFSPEVGTAIDQVVNGTPVSRALDLMSKAAPTGVVSSGLSAGVPFMVGNAIGGPGMGAALGATSLTLGSGARSLANANVSRRAEIAELLARNGGALDQAPMIDPATQKIIAAMLAGQTSQYAD